MSERSAGRHAESRRIGLGAFLAALVVTLGLQAETRAFETDQYLALDAQIADSAEPVNEYLNRELADFLQRERLGRRECGQVTQRFFRHLFQGLLASRLQKNLKIDPEVDLYPADAGYREYLRQSVYRRPSFPYVLPLSPTIRIGEVRFGLDKFGHLFGFGRRYYKRYSRLRNRGRSEEEALRAVIIRGLHMERVFLGGILDGVFSYGDLEANYQGLRLARSFCEGEDAVLERVRKGWRQTRPVDLRDFVTPSFDESFNNNHYPWPRWNKVRPILAAEYCDRYFSPQVQARMQRYRALDRPNVSKRLIREYFERKGRDLQSLHSMETICGQRNSMTMAAAAGE